MQLVIQAIIHAMMEGLQGGHQHANIARRTHCQQEAATKTHMLWSKSFLGIGNLSSRHAEATASTSQL
jgi:hypothetical protein